VSIPYWTYLLGPPCRAPTCYPFRTWRLSELKRKGWRPP